MAYTSGGRVSFVDKGAYSPTTTYKRLDYVKYSDCIFVAKKTTLGNTPDPTVDTEFWTKLVSASADMYVYDSAGNVAPQQPGIQFMNGSIENDTTNNRTKVTIGITDAEWAAIQNILQ